MSVLHAHSRAEICLLTGRKLPTNEGDSVANAPPEVFTDICRWLYTQFLAVDANFKLKLKDRGLKDVELSPGWAYFVEEDTYQSVVGSFADETEVRV